jgi:hypothetical protein
MTDLPLSALLPQTLVAFTIEFDNEFEHRIPHRTTDYGAATDFLPIGAHARGWRREPPERGATSGTGRDPSLSALLSRVLYTYALQFDAGNGPSLTFSANVLRVLDPDGVPVARVAPRTGIAKMGVENSLSLLARGDLVGGGTAEDSPLFGALEPYPDGWRAQLAPPETLPHFPMVSHRGAFPDGS